MTTFQTEIKTTTQSVTQDPVQQTEVLPSTFTQQIGQSNLIKGQFLPVVTNQILTPIEGKNIGTVHLNTQSLSTVELGAQNLGTVDLGIQSLQTVDLGTKNIGTVDLGTKNLGTVDLGPQNLGTVDLGTTQVEEKKKMKNYNNVEK